jgi:GNAT superfamily N-acetyltransferase
VRPLGEADRPAILAHFLALDARDRALRFHAGRSDDTLARYVAGIDFARMLLAGAQGPADGRLLALAEAHLDDAHAPSCAELAVSVLADCRREGLGRRVVAHALRLAAARGARRAEFFYGADNRPLIRLVRSLGARITPDGHAVLPLALQLAA